MIKTKKMLIKFKFFILIFFFYSCAGVKSTEQPPEPPAFNFLHQDKSLTEVIDLAIAEEKLVFVDIYAEWCLPCKLMDEEVFTDKELGDYFNEHFINFKVNGEKEYGPDIAFLYGVRAYPTLLFLDTKGRIINKKEGTAFHRELRKMAIESLDSIPEN